jgi:hypothetical protein
MEVIQQLNEMGQAQNLFYQLTDAEMQRANELIDLIDEFRLPPEYSICLYPVEILTQFGSTYYGLCLQLSTDEQWCHYLFPGAPPKIEDLAPAIRTGLLRLGYDFDDDTTDDWNDEVEVETLDPDKWLEDW